MLNLFLLKVGKVVLKVIFAIFLVGTLTATNALFNVTKVIDGDTLLLSNGEKVRLIGVDTPELYHPLKPVQYFAIQASEFTRKMSEGKKVRLEFDWQKRDEYNRLLAYVYLEGGTFLNAEVIKQGYGFAYTKYPFKYLEDFRQYEKEAREGERGLWKGGGRAELEWIEKKGIEPYQVYPMANRLWGIKYDGFVKVRITLEELPNVLGELRIWVFEFSEKDLAKKLIENGWERID